MPTKNVLVRMLQNAWIHTSQYFCNDVVSMPAKLATAHEKAGLVDSDPDAVAYARDQLGAVPKEHVVPDAPAAAAPAEVSAQGTSAGQANAETEARAVVPAADAPAESAEQQQSLVDPQ
ncbi:hypothetical protein [Caballeronia sp. dw_276]|uniref:hypothetical protein n=1 Tax=Caballeronia sp. dw_276 TaxID=2719795 RepID=UPI001BD321B0|nr:hypothetical protein [Caballeronia sp. dw_276]